MKKQTHYTLLLIILSLLFFRKTQAQSIIAQSTSFVPSGYSLVNDNFPFTQYREIGQTFKSLLTTTISTIEIVSSGGDGLTCDVQIYSNSAQNVWGSLLNTKTNVAISGSVGWVTIDVSALNISVTAGSYYGIKLIPHFGGYVGFYVSNNDYADGQAWTSNGFEPANDFAFKVLTNATLPVSFISFTAQKHTNNVLLKWSTASEQNSKDFIIQHSTDGNHWNNTGAVPAAGNSNSILNYSYTHTDPVTGINYYRLLQTDIDGKSSTSDIRTVQFTNAGDAVFTVMDNPVRNGQLKLRLNIPATLSLYNTNGKLLWKRQLNAGSQQLDVSDYSKGIYLLKSGESTRRIVIR